MEMNWNLKLLYKDITDPQLEKDISFWQENTNAFINKWSKRDDYTKDPKVLSLALDEYEKLLTDPTNTKPEYYIWLKRSLNQNDTTLKAKENLLNDISIKLYNNLQFFTLNISKIPKDKQDMFLEFEGLKEYRHFLETSFNSAKYLLSDNEEKVFNIKSKTSYSNWVSMLEELLSKQMLDVYEESGEKKQIPYSEISRYLSSRDEKVRSKAAEEFLAVNKKYIEIAEYEINSVLENKKVSDEYRGVPTPETRRLLSDDMDPEVVKALVSVVTDNFDIPQRYYKLKAKLLKKDKLIYPDRMIPASSVDKEYSFEDSKRLVGDVFTRLDSEFGDIFTNFLNDGRYDVYPKESKSGGAFCISVSKSTPTYMLLNHTDKLKDVLTLAHESGHGIHAELSHKQNGLNDGHSTATAEVASTFFEDFVLEEIMRVSDDDVKRELLIEKLDDDISTIFRQVACYNFELDLHSSFREVGYLSKERVSDIFSKHMLSYLGDIMVKDEHMETGWVYWSHIRNFFYVYSYSAGLLISKALQRMVRENPKDIVRVKEFLSSGDSLSPKDIFMSIGIDISKREFWESGIKEVRDLLEELENCLN